MAPSKLYLYLVAGVAVFGVNVAYAVVPLSMTTEWTYNKPVIVTGDNLDGDDPYWNKLCIAPVADKTIKKCYDPSNTKDELAIEKWDNSNLSFYAPPDIPVNGIVILQVRSSVQHCFGSAGCNDHTEDTEREIGNYRAKPFVTDLVDSTTGKNVYEMKANTTYKVKGAFFGESKGSIFMQGKRGSNQLPSNEITSWSYNEITFRTPAGDAPIAFSVNNGAIATKYDFLDATSSSSSSSVSSSSKSSSSSSSSSQRAQMDMQLFTDVDVSNPYHEGIGWAKQSGILQGYPDGTFQPERTVNRAEFLKIVLGAKGINVSDVSGSSGFKDVDENGWYAPYVRYAKQQGIIQGYADGTFKPNQTVNFAEALKMAYNALGVTTADVGGNWYDRFLQHAKANNVLYTSNVQIDGGMSRKDVVWIAWKLMTHEGSWQQASKSSVSSSSSNTASVQFKDGTYVVGKDIQAGTYRTRRAASGCYYSRLNGFSGQLEDINSNELTNAASVVTIMESDKGFKSSGCGTWTQDLSAITTSRTSFGDGTFIVGTDIDAGTYRNSGGSTCYYSRLSGFSGELDDIVSNELTSASAIVTIDSSDKGFKSSGCGTWSKM